MKRVDLPDYLNSFNNHVEEVLNFIIDIHPLICSSHRKIIKEFSYNGEFLYAKIRLMDMINGKWKFI